MDVTVKGWVLRETPTGMAVIFLWEDRQQAMDTVCLPKSQISISKGVFVDEVTLPEWLAIKTGLS